MKRTPGSAAYGEKWGRALEKLKRRLEQELRRLARVLNRKCADLPANQLLTGFVCFCLLSGLVFSCIIWKAFRPSNGIPVPEQIVIPPFRLQKTHQDPDSGIVRLRLRLDSLRQAKNADSLFRHIELERPGLLDSIDLLDSIYKIN